MRKNPRLFRMTATVALTALLLDTVLPLAAVAQPGPPPLPSPGEGRPDLNQADPPARVGRIARMTGTVSFHNLGDTQWSTATPNYPVASGNSFWTEPSSESELEISASRIAMAGATEFDIASLDANGLQGVAAQGEIYVHTRGLTPNETWSIQTPRGQVSLSGEGRYEIAAGTTDQPTLVTVLEGAAQVTGPGVSLQIAAGQTATITGTDSFQGSIGPAQRDDFLTARLEAERPPPPLAAGVPAQVVYAMPGGSDLADTGTWSQAPEYGHVWYPPVAATWAPYREGHWAYVAPWGWTWVDDAPWGFAPFHYGRWIQIEGRWAWTPGAAVAAGPPVYAPALVTFIGIGAGIAIGAALASGSIGWIPLGPHEQYHPWYHASNAYVQQLNVSHVTNITNITNSSNNVTINNYVNRGAATSIPAAAMTASHPVQAIAQPVTAQQLAAARPIAGQQQPIRPTAATAGVTQAVARQLNLAPAPGAVQAAPGPTVHPVAAGTTGFTRPAFTPATRTQTPGAIEPNHPAPAAPGSSPAATALPGAAQPSQPAGVSPQAEPIAPHVPGSQITPHPAATVPGSNPAATALPGAGQPAQPMAVRPQAEPIAPHPAPPMTPHPAATVPGSNPPATAMPAAAGPARPAAVNPQAPPIVPYSAPHPAAEPAARPVPAPAPAAERFVPQTTARPAPAAVNAAPRAEPPHAAPPAPPAPRPEVRPPAGPAPPAQPQPAEHKKDPNQR